jgi:hypothetical protein
MSALLAEVIVPMAATNPFEFGTTTRQKVPQQPVPSIRRSSCRLQ